MKNNKSASTTNNNKDKPIKSLFHQSSFVYLKFIHSFVDSGSKYEGLVMLCV
jgi:hypothetical protein